MPKKKKVRPPPTVLRDIDRALINAVMFDLGIIPMEKSTFDMRRALRQLSPEDAMKFKRKFRKVWRKAMRVEIARAGVKKQSAVELSTKHRLGVGNASPSRYQRSERKRLVFDLLWNEIIGPRVEAFEASSETQKETEI